MGRGVWGVERAFAVERLIGVGLGGGGVEVGESQGDFLMERGSRRKGASWDLLGPVHGRTDFSRIFIFGPPDFFADFLAGFFLLIFVGKSAQKNPPGKSPGKSSKIYTTKILQHISADWPGQNLPM